MTKKNIAALASAAVLLVALVCGGAYLLNRSAENIDVSTENEELYVFEKNVKLPEGLAVFSEEGRPAADITPALWRATSPEGRRIYLFGAVHILSEDCYPLPDYLRDAFSDCAFVCPEINNVDPGFFGEETVYSSPERLPDGEKLSDHLSPEQYEVLSAFIAAKGGSIDDHQQESPWYVYENQVLAGTKDNDISGETYSTDYGADRILQIMANIDGKEIVSLETVQEKNSFNSALPEDVMGAVIEMRCRQLEENDSSFLASLDAWKQGDVETLCRVDHDTAGVSEKSVPLIEEYYRLFIDGRNRKMADRLEELLAQDRGNILAVPGATHMNGEEGIPALLEKDGFTVERIG